MKYVLLLALVFLTSGMFGQTNLKTSAGFNSKLLQPAKYKMRWFIQKDTLIKTIGTIETNLEIKEGKLIISQYVILVSSAHLWIDSTIAEYETLKPIYHSSYNAQRDMTLYYYSGQIRGYFRDHIKKTEYNITDTCTGGFYDSNISPFLLTCLPLKKDFKTSFSVYNLGGPSVYGIKHITVTDTKESTYKTQGRRKKKVFVLDVYDDISLSTATYYIDKRTRATYEIAVKTPNGIMRMQLDE